MDELSTFFSTIAQVSATFMGFALVIPAIKALSSGLFAAGGKYIKPSVLVKKFFFFISFPLFVLSNPLIVSITILPDSSLPLFTKWFVCFSAFLFPFWLYWLQYNSKFQERRIVYLMLEIFPWIFIPHLGFVILFLICRECHQFFWLFLNWDTLSLVLIGFILILRNLMISPEKGIFFREKDKQENLKDVVRFWTDNSLSLTPKDNQEVEGILTVIKDAKNAIKEREESINRLKSIGAKLKNKEQNKEQDKKRIREIKLSIAGSNAEIKNIKVFLDDIINKLKANILEKSRLTLSDCAGIEKRLDKARIHIWEFRQGTTRLEEFINKVFEEE